MSIHLIMGPMFSGKTSELMRLYRRARIAGKSCVIVKYQHDNRYQQDDQDQALYTHDQISIKNVINSINDSLKTTLTYYLTNLVSPTWFFIDEIQFYTDAAEICDHLANQGHTLIVTGLQGDSNRQLFPSMIDLIPKCDKITHLTAIDPQNGEEAPFTARIVSNQNQILIGGTNCYRAASRKTYNT